MDLDSLRAPAAPATGSVGGFVAPAASLADPPAPRSPADPAGAPPVLVSHTLCPYVQRVAIVLAEKGVPFERRDIDLANKPDWFVRVSPLGKTPVLLTGGEAVFESAVICEYLDDTTLPRLHPADPLQRARHRSWIEFGSSLLSMIAAFYTASDEAALQDRATDIRMRLQRLETVLQDGPFFSGEAFCMVDAVFAPVFRYFDVFDGIGDFGFWEDCPKVRRWRLAASRRPSVRQAVSDDYPALLTAFLRARESALGRRFA